VFVFIFISDGSSDESLLLFSYGQMSS